MILRGVSSKIIEPLGRVLSRPYEAVSERIRTGMNWTKYPKWSLVRGLKQMVTWPRIVLKEEVTL